MNKIDWRRVFIGIIFYSIGYGAILFFTDDAPADQIALQAILFGTLFSLGYHGIVQPFLLNKRPPR